MIIWGKIVGGILGLTFSIPGIIIGVILGHIFDIGLKKTMYVEVSTEVQTIFFDISFATMGYISRNKNIALSAIKEMNLDEYNTKLALTSFEKGFNNFNLEQELEKLLIYCGKQQDLLNFFMELQIKAVMFDGVVDFNEKKILIIIGKKLGFKDDYLSFLFTHETASEKITKSHTVKSAYDVLGVTEQSSNKEIKNSYKKLINKHHPDKLIAKGLPISMIEIAKEKTQEITLAYKEICEARGFR